MERSSFAVLFFIRESKVRKDGNAPIEASITINGERCFFSTGKKVKATTWDKNKQLVKGKDEEAISLNNYLKSVKAKLYEKEAELLDRGFVITAQLLYDAYFDKVECLKERSLLSILEEHNAERKAMVGKTVAPATYWVFEYTARLLKEFILQKYSGKVVEQAMKELLFLFLFFIIVVALIGGHTFIGAGIFLCWLVYLLAYTDFIIPKWIKVEILHFIKKKVFKAPTKEK